MKEGLKYGNIEDIIGFSPQAIIASKVADRTFAYQLLSSEGAQMYGGTLFPNYPPFKGISTNQPIPNGQHILLLPVYALHQQGQGDLMHVEGVSLGTAMRRLVRDADDEPRVKSRFDRAAMAGDITALAYWLRGLVQILRSESVKLDYSLLAEDLYWFQFPERRSAVRLRWGRDFYAKDENQLFPLTLILMSKKEIYYERI